MKINNCEQRSPEWFSLKAGMVGGTRFGQAISDRENQLIYELINERLDGMSEMSDYTDEDIEFGIENEPIARKLYIEKSGINFNEVGLIYSDFCGIHLQSPDGLSDDQTQILEIKSTRHGTKQIKRFFKGVESDKIGQIISYFAISDQIKAVHHVSFCPFRPERMLVSYIFTIDSIVKVGKVEKPISYFVDLGRKKLLEIEQELPELTNQFIF